MLTREQIKSNIDALESQGAKPEEIQGWLDSLKTDSSNAPSQPEQKNYSLGEVLPTAISNIPKSVGGLVGGITSAVTHPVETVKTLGKIAVGAGEAGIGAVSGEKVDTPETQTFGNLVDYFKNRYGGVENVKRTIAEDPAGFALDVSMFLDAGASAAGKIGDVSKIGEISKAGEVAGKIGETVDPLRNTAKLAGKVGETAGKGASRISGESIGAVTGVGYGSVRRIYQAIKAGGERAKTAYSALRGEVSPEQAVMDAKTSISTLYENRANQYAEDSSKLKIKSGVESLNTADVKAIAKDTLKNKLDLPTRELATKDGTKLEIDFSSRPSMDASGIKKVSDVIYNWKDTTIKGLNRLRQEIEGFKKGGANLSPADNRFNKFINDSADRLDSYLKDKVEGYEEMNKNYRESSTQIKQIEDYLSLGNKKSVDAAYRKLSSIMRVNNEFRLKLVKELDDLSGGKILDEISGAQMNELFPRGIIRQFEVGGAILGIAEGALIPLLKVAAFTSPRIMGEFIGALGFTGRAAEKATEILQKIAPTAGKYISPALKAGYYSTKSPGKTKEKE